MDTFLIIVLLAAIALMLAYLVYGKFRKEKKGRDPQQYIDGLKALLDGREEAAFSKFKEVLSEDTENIDAYIRVGAILRKYGKTDKALQVHQDLTIRHNLTHYEKSMILKELALDFIALKDHDAAKRALKELYSYDSNNRWAAERLLEVYAKDSDWDNAFEIRETLLKIEGSKTRAPLAIYKYFQGMRLYDKKEYHKARVIFKEAINLDTACAPAYVFIGDSYMAENRVDDAIAIWRKFIQIVPDQAQLVLGRLKKALFEVGRFGEIADVCHEVLRSAPKNMDAQLLLADYHSKKGENAEASELFYKAFEDHPDSRLPAIQLARHYIMNDDKKKLRELIGKLEEKYQIAEQEYHCSICGHKSKNKLWLCPGCKAVDSFVIQ